MKYGLYYFKNTHNLGDDICAYAQSLFYPHIDYLIDNTSVYRFKSESNEDVATIIGALVEPRNYEWCFLPPSNVIPFFADAYFGNSMWEFLQNEPIIKYMKAYAPIGVRTTSATAKFLDLGIDAYCSSCVTLTLPEFKKNSERYICLVDVPEFVEKYIRDVAGEKIEIRVMTHSFLNHGAGYINHRNISIQYRFKQIEELLQIYADARLVVTSKLQCALSCLTQHTPVLLTLPKDRSGIIDMDERIGCFFDLFNICWYEDFKAGSVSYDFQNPPHNSDKYLTYKNVLNKNISDFILQCERGEVVRKEVFSEKERLEILTEILENKVYQLKNVVDNKNQILGERKGYEGIIWEREKAILRLQQRLRKYESFNEWENIEFFDDWSARSRELADFISDDCTSILDIGCGEMHIKKYLRQGINYYGCDYKKRDDNTIICDLAIGEFPDIEVDTCFMAGVLEYLTNWKDVIKNMSNHCRQIVMSYCIIEASEKRNPRIVTNISEKELLEYIDSLGFILKEKKQVTDNSFGYNFIKERNFDA